MAEKKLFPRKLVVAWRFRPRLEFYRHHDEIGLELEENGEFPDWKRGDRALAVVDRKTHRKLEMTNGHVIFERNFDDQHDINKEVDYALHLHERYLKRFNPTLYTGLWVRHWFALAVDHGFDAIVRRLTTRLFMNDSKVNAILGAEVVDTQYVMDLKSEDGGWKASLRIGPMVKEEFLKQVPFDEFVFDPATSAHSFTSFCDAIPKELVYFDLNWSVADVDPDEVDAKVKSGCDYIAKSARSFIHYYNNG